MFTIDELSPFLIKTVYDNLKNADEEVFDSVLDAAIRIIKKRSGLDDEAELSQKHLLPCAWIMSYVYIQTYDHIEEEDSARFKQLYDNAINMLDKAPEKSKKVGQFEGVWP